MPALLHVQVILPGLLANKRQKEKLEQMNIFFDQILILSPRNEDIYAALLLLTLTMRHKIGLHSLIGFLSDRQLTVGWTDPLN